MHRNTAEYRKKGFCPHEVRDVSAEAYCCRKGESREREREGSKKGSLSADFKFLLSKLTGKI